MDKISFAQSFTESLSKLNPVLQGKAFASVFQFATAKDEHIKSLHFEKVVGAAEEKMSSIRIDRGYRIILCWVETLQDYLFLYAGEHDPSYEWAKKKRISVNEKTFSLQLYDVSNTPASPLEDGLFSAMKYSDKSLLQIGVPEELLPDVRAISNEDQLLEKEGTFPAEVLDRLLDLAAGASLRSILEEVAENKRAANGDVMQNPDTLRFFSAPYGGAEMQDALDSLEAWRVFLHPSQRKLIHERFAGPSLVLGGAGTGKTITALHRAKALAARLIAEKTDGKILYTFFNKSLIGDVTDRLKKICTSEELRRIDIQNVDRLLTQLTRLPGYERARILYSNDKQYTQLWKDAIAIGDPAQTRSAEFYQKEWDRIIAGQEAFTLEKYLQVKRVGGEKPLSAGQRRKVWKVFDAYRQLMQERQLFDDKTALYQYRQVIAQQPEPVYRHVIVDEAQDLSAGALRLLRTLAGPEREDDIFLVGDPRQKIYDRHVSMDGCGIHVQGRIRHLYLNYRTTYELHRSAIHMLEGESFDNLNGEIDLDTRYRSYLFGARPQVCFSSGEEDEMQWILEEIKKLENSGMLDQNICLTTYSRSAVKAYIKQLNDNGIRSYELKQGDDRTMEGVRVGTMHRVKGLEFQCMFIAGVNKDVFPPKDPKRLRESKCLMYVALTRSQKGAYVSGYGKAPSEFLTALMERDPSLRRA